LREEGNELNDRNRSSPPGGISSLSVNYSPLLTACLQALTQGKFTTLLDPSRILAVLELVRYAAERSNEEVIELGVYKGGSAAATAWILRRARLERTVHLCDTFSGMPKTLEWEFHKEFDFADTSLKTVSERLGRFALGFPFLFHAGVFSDTLPGLRDRRFCFAHVDADLYTSVREACEFVYPRMPKGGIILFDDYGAPTCPGAKKAVDEFFADKLEKPSHVSECAYAICMGRERMDFPALISKRTFVPALINAAYRVPARRIQRQTRAGLERIVSPRITKLLLGPVLHRRHRGDGLSPSVREAKNILVVRQDNLGDLILMSPFLRELRRSNPGAWITLVVDSRFLNLVELCPYVNEVLGADFPYCGRALIPTLVIRALRFSKAQLWQRRFDLALLPRWDADLHHSSFIAYFSRASHRVGYSEKVHPLKQQVNRGFDSLLTRPVDERVLKHEVQRNLDFLRDAGGAVTDESLELWLSDEDRSTVRTALDSRGLRSGDLLVGLVPGGIFLRRLWPIDRFVELGRLLEREFGARIVIVGGSEDREIALRLQDAIAGTTNFAGELTLRQSGALLEQMQLVIANDTGPMHLAAAAGACVVEISCHPGSGDPNHANSPVRFRPWAEETVVVQPAQPMEPCGSGCEQYEAHCILGVFTEAVAEAAVSLLKSRLSKKLSQPYERYQTAKNTSVG
jgi:ADP-heptose:LPS heptosyltransferase